MLVLLKLSKLTWVISKNWIYYAVHRNTKYYLIASYLLEKTTNNRTSSENTSKPDEVHKSTKSIRDKVNQLILFKIN